MTFETVIIIGAVFVLVGVMTTLVRYDSPNKTKPVQKPTNEELSTKAKVQQKRKPK